MGNTIWKFPLEITDHQSIKMPAGARVLAVQTQNGIPCIWAIVQPENPPEIREFSVFGTGPSLPSDLSTYSYVGTFQVHNGALVFHLFEVIDGIF